MDILVATMYGSGDMEDSQETSVNPLESGFIDEGCMSGPAGAAYWDVSSGESYGNGHRYEREETAYMAKVPSKHK